MLYILDDLYNIISSSVAGGTGEFTIRMNPDSEIYKGHFPGNSITPGVCLLQIAVELVERMIGRRCILTGAKNIKYLQTLKPQEHPEVKYILSCESLEDGNVAVKAEVRDGDIVFTKMNFVVEI